MGVFVQRVDERLNDGQRTVVRTSVAPSFQVVGLWYVPVRHTSCFIHMLPHVYRSGHLAHRLFESEFRRCAVHRVHVEHEKHVDAATTHSIDQFGQCFTLERGRIVLRVEERDRLVEAAQLLIDRHSQRMHGGGLRFACYHYALRTGTLKVVDDGINVHLFMLGERTSGRNVNAKR